MTEAEHENETQQLHENGDNNNVNDTYWRSKFGFEQQEVYDFANKFLKEKVNKAFHVTYQDNLKLIALKKQAKFGSYDPQKATAIGLLDVVGRDRRLHWQKLGDMSKVEAQQQFIDLVNRICPLFLPFLEAQKSEREEHERQRLAAEEAEEQEQARLAAVAASAHAERTERMQRDQQMRRLEAQIRAALNQQTNLQFRRYVQQQHPDDVAKQDELIAQLQEEHFHQYIAQVYPRQLRLQQEQQQGFVDLTDGPQPTTLPSPSLVSDRGLVQLLQSNGPVPVTNSRIEDQIGVEGGDQFSQPQTSPRNQHQQQPLNSSDQLENINEEGVLESDAADSNSAAPSREQMPAPSMWTRKDIEEFKVSVAKEQHSVIKVGSGEVVTIRVPTHHVGKSIFWEFATDHYDIGFGLFFEWSAPSDTDQVTVHVTSSAGTSPLDGGKSSEANEGTRECNAAAAIQAGASVVGDSILDNASPKPGRKHLSSCSEEDAASPTDEIIPIYRRDSYHEVYCGSHQYPGRGIYLLTFDNSYSLWRSKWLYYRIYYTC